MKELNELNSDRLSNNDFKDTNSEVLITDKIASLEKDLEKKDTMISTLKDYITKLKDELFALKSSYETQSEELIQAKEETEALRKYYEVPVKGTHSSIAQENRNLLMLNDSMEHQLQLMKKEIKSKDEEIEKLREEIEGFQSSSNEGSESDKVKELERKLRLASKTTNELMQKNAMASKTNEELKIRLEKHKIKNKKMSKQLMTPRNKSKNAAGNLQSLKRQLSEISETGSPLINPQLSSDILISIKIQIEKVYKMLFFDLNKVTSEGDTSVYLMSSPDLCAVEQEINKIVMNLQEKIDNVVDKNEGIRTLRRSSLNFESIAKTFKSKKHK